MPELGIRKRVFWNYEVTLTIATADTTILFDCTPPAGSAMQHLNGSAYCNDDVALTLQAWKFGSAASGKEVTTISQIASAATPLASWPHHTNLPTTAGFLAESTETVICNPECFHIVTGLVHVGHTLLIRMTAELLGTETAPTLSVARSGTPANVTGLATPTRNTVTVVYT